MNGMERNTDIPAALPADAAEPVVATPESRPRRQVQEPGRADPGAAGVKARHPLEELQQQLQQETQQQ